MKRANRRKSIIIVSALTAVIVVGGGIALAHYRSVHHGTAITPDPSIATGGHGADTTTHAGPTHDSTPSPTVTPTDPVHTPSTTLAKPIETLNLSTASLSDGGTGTAMDSTCASVTGASCYIKATMGGTVVIVSETKTVTDASGGTVDLPWYAKKLGAAGTWSIQAVATKDGQTTASDSWKLTVTQ